MASSDVDIVRLALDAFGRGDVDVALECLHPEAVCTRWDPDHVVFHGRDGLLRMVDDWTEGFDEWTYDADDPTEHGDRVIAHVRQRGRGAGSRVPVEGEFWYVFDIAGGLIVRFDIYADRDKAYAAA